MSNDLYNYLKAQPWGIVIVTIIIIFGGIMYIWKTFPDAIREKVIIHIYERYIKILSKRGIEYLLYSTIVILLVIFTVRLQFATSPPTKTNNIYKTKSTKQIPDISKAKNVYIATSKSDLLIKRGEVDDVSPKGFQGFFNVFIPPRKGSVYSFADILIKGDVKPNFFITCRVASGLGINTLELKGLGVFFLLSADAKRYMIYNSEENLSSWKPLTIPENENPWKTIGMHQVGRHVDVYINSHCIDSFELWHAPASGKVGTFFKADAQIGGKAEFQRLAVYEF